MIYVAAVIFGALAFLGIGEWVAMRTRWPMPAVLVIGILAAWAAAYVVLCLGGVR